MPDTPLIRPVRRADYERWYPLWADYNAFYGRGGASALPQEITAATWGRFFDPAEPMYAFVAELGDDLIGLAHFLLHRTTIRIEPTAYMQDLLVRADVRGSGIGRRLIAAVYGRAEELGATGVYWHTHETNEIARRLYDRIGDKTGFIVYGHRW